VKTNTDFKQFLPSLSWPQSSSHFLRARNTMMANKTKNNQKISTLHSSYI